MKRILLLCWPLILCAGCDQIALSGCSPTATTTVDQDQNHHNGSTPTPTPSPSPTPSPVLFPTGAPCSNNIECLSVACIGGVCR